MKLAAQSPVDDPSNTGRNEDRAELFDKLKSDQLHPDRMGLHESHSVKPLRWHVEKHF